MHVRHNKNPRNGYRAVGSRSSPEGPTRGGPGFYDSESRSFNRSFGGNQRQNRHRNFRRPPPVPPVPARTDVFMEVGRLAAEYLVSQGVLPPTALPAKWQNESLKKPLSESREFRPHGEENIQLPGEGGTSGLARLGNTNFDGESSRRKYSDDYSPAGPRNHAREKRSGGSSRNYGSSWDRECERTGTLSDGHRDRTSPHRDLEWDSSPRHREEHSIGRNYGERRAGDYDFNYGRHEEKQFGKDDDRMGVDQESRSRFHDEQVLRKGDNDMSELACTSATPPKVMDNKDSESESKGQPIELSEMKDSDVVKDAPDVTNGEIKTNSLDMGSSLQMTDNKLRTFGEAAEVDLKNKGEITGEINDPGLGETVKEIIFSGHTTHENFTMPTSLSENSSTDLKVLCKLANVPTRTRTSLAKGTKRSSILDGRGIDNIGPNESMVNDRNLGIFTNDVSSGHCDEPKMLNSENPTDLTSRVVKEEKELYFHDVIEPAREMGSGNSVGDAKPSSVLLLDQASGARPGSSEDGKLENDQCFNMEMYGSGRSEGTLVEKRGEKRHHGGIDKDEQHARRKEWLHQSTRGWFSPGSTDAGECSNLLNPVSIHVDSIGDSLSSGENETRASYSCLDGNITLPGLMKKPNFMDMVEKQFLPSSFKICDLNLMESSDGLENQDQDVILMYPSVAAVKKSASPIDINLSICNPVTSAENSKCVVGGKAVEIIDLEGDSAPEDKTLSITERRAENAFMGLEEFSNPVPNSADNPESQDGYGLMISELLSNDFPSVTPVPGDANPLDNVGLHNGEVPLADDDSIYMSLGEIPFLSFLRNWENPTPPHEDGKPF